AGQAGEAEGGGGGDPRRGPGERRVPRQHGVGAVQAEEVQGGAALFGEGGGRRGRRQPPGDLGPPRRLLPGPRAEEEGGRDVGEGAEAGGGQPPGPGAAAGGRGEAPQGPRGAEGRRRVTAGCQREPASRERERPERWPPVAHAPASPEPRARGAG